MARRSRRFSWFCWGFLFGAYGGIALLSILAVLFPVVVTTTNLNVTLTTTTSPWWDLPLSASPGIVLLALAVREAILGRREADQGTSVPTPLTASQAEGTSAGWTETVQRCQQRVTHAKSEVEWSFVPLVLGWFAFIELYFYFLVQYSSLSTGNLPIDTFFGPAIAFASLIVLWPLYRFAKGWIAGYQLLLNQQVGELSKLEAEFLWRFTGAGLPA